MYENRVGEHLEPVPFENTGRGSQVDLGRIRILAQARLRAGGKTAER